MWLKKDEFKRSVTLALTVWFALTAALVQSLHNHRSDESATTDSCPTVGNHLQSGAGIYRDATWLTTAGTHELNSRIHLDYCPACLFLNHCHRGAVVSEVHIPTQDPDEHLFQCVDSRYSAPFTGFYSSRAPPISVT
ncbi:MAG: hypothetical protein JSW58_16355 [Candidatus Latescibacterota bacterium]|nr:MAG: hypothetical protein JSW58_16355 [Candidatus Latescibacterota bacterium]